MIFQRYNKKTHSDDDSTTLSSINTKSSRSIRRLKPRIAIRSPKPLRKMGLFMKLSRYLGCNLIAIDGIDGASRTSPIDQNQTTKAEETPPAVVSQEITLETVVRMLTELQTTVNDMKVELIGTAGKEAAKKFSISLFVLEENKIDRTRNEVIYGHGILLRCCEENEFAILTAGHVAIQLFNIRKKFTKIGFFNGTTYEIDHEVDSKLFLANDYIKHGTCDVGALVVRLKEGPREDSFEDLVFSGAPSFDTKFIGRSLDYCFQSYPFRMTGDRVGLPTPYTGVCTGTPMFSSNGELLSVLHGEWRHHGRKLYTSKTSDNVPSQRTNEDSRRVYVDTVKELCKLKLWDRSQFDFIEEVEALDEHYGCKDATMKYRKPSSDDPKYEPNSLAQQFYENMEKKLGGGSGTKAFTNSYFTIHEICDDVIRNVQNETVESLDQYVVSPSESTYKACAPSEQI